MISLLALLGDAAAVFAGFMVSTWVRFDSGLIEMRYGRPDNLYELYAVGAVVAMLFFLLVFRILGLYQRPQTGLFSNKIPRLVRACLIGTVITVILAFAMQNEMRTGSEFSRLTIAISFVVISIFAVIERYILFRIERWLSSIMGRNSKVLIIGTDSVSFNVAKTLEREVTLRSEVVGFVGTDDVKPDAAIPAEKILGSLSEMEKLVESNKVDQVIITNSHLLPHARMVELILMCERNLIAFHIVPDLFRIMTCSTDIQLLDDIPLIGLKEWPLDLFWNRMLKRMEDITGAFVGLVIALPVIAVSAIFVKKSSPGGMFFGQERCGERGKKFTLYKLRTMPVGAEDDTGPVFASPDDPRVTRVGAFLRKHNIDELPQLWNVLKGDMSLVGPRPERPHFVDQFSKDIGRYMTRHISRPGMTGWAQVNGLRGGPCTEDRVKHDLYYLENWSLAFDFKILVRTLFAGKNAY